MCTPWIWKIHYGPPTQNFEKNISYPSPWILNRCKSLTRCNVCEDPSSSLCIIWMDVQECKMVFKFLSLSSPWWYFFFWKNFLLLMIFFFLPLMILFTPDHNTSAVCLSVRSFVCQMLFGVPLGLSSFVIWFEF